MDIDKIINIVRESKINEEMMSTGSTAGAPGFSSKADAEGPVAGYDKPLGKGRRGKKYMKSNVSYKLWRRGR
jgi:hypothetical protein